jgi:hypothetical protein
MTNRRGVFRRKAGEFGSTPYALGSDSVWRSCGIPDRRDRDVCKLLSGEKIERTIVLPTMTVTKENAEQIMKDNGLL